MKIVAVTDRSIAEQYYLRRFHEVASSGIDAMILREKDMDADDFSLLAHHMSEFCNEVGTALVVNSDVETAREIGAPVQVPFSRLSDSIHDLRGVEFGVSVHSIDEAMSAYGSGADWIVFGNVFETTCKPGKASMGIEYLAHLCEVVPIPVFAIGGIDSGNIGLCADAGVSGVCIRSPFMTCPSPTRLVSELRDAVSGYTVCQ